MFDSSTTVDQPEPPGRAELRTGILASVSRSFYLTLRLLPWQVRDSISLAYLLARATDTLADSTDSSVASRMELLDLLATQIQTGVVPASLKKIETDAAPLQSHPGEKRLLSSLPVLLEWLEESPDATSIRKVLAVITSGQKLDLERFGNTDGLRVLQTADQLDDYTWRVAGCVGEFWTEICARRLANFSKTDPEKLMPLGIAFGKGLQLVNILRDLPRDLAAGRCYLPLEEPAALSEWQELRSRPGPIIPMTVDWLEQALAHLAQGLQYVLAVRPFRVRLACALPLLLAVETLRLLALELAEARLATVKVSRRRVYALLFALSATGCPGFLVGALFHRSLQATRRILADRELRNREDPGSSEPRR